MTKTAVIYTRQSTPKQQSIPAQIKALEDYASQHNTQVLAIFQDAMSGKDTNREDFNAMVEYISTHDVDVLLVWRYDRIARNLKDLESFLMLCSDLNVSVISINEKLGHNRAQDVFMLQMLGAVGQYQREIIKENQQIAYQQKYDEGKILSGTVSYGYRLINDTLEVKENEAAVVRLIFYLYTQKELGYKAISEHLNASGNLNRDGKWWHAVRIKSILDNPFYTGAIQSKYGDANSHQLPLIQKERFEQAQAIQLSRNTLKQLVTRRYVLQGKIKCPHCHTVCTPTHTLNGQRDYYYYSCSLYTSGGKRHCPGMILNALEVEDFISSKLHQFIQSDFVAGQLKSHITRTNYDIDRTNQQKQNKLKQRQRQIMDAYEKELLDDDQLSDKLVALNGRKAKLKLKPRIPESITNLIDRNLLIDNNPTLPQYTLYQSIIERIAVDEEKNVIAIYLTGFRENILEEEDDVS
ncbi:MAG: recombinase family protein [Ruoffia tabacinasalis]|uniref:recombinase family protein n=1 Tax=unclassified Ruoffia TaxID=2862149 RepID=UPI000EC9BE25|nr:hypothetical protein [Aerococcaceae bacterium]